MDKAKVPKTKGESMNRELVKLMLQDGVDIDVINDVLKHPTKYIQMLSICNGEFIELPICCFMMEESLTEGQKIEALFILDSYICDWYMWQEAVDFLYSNDTYDPIDEIMDALPSNDGIFLTPEEISSFLKGIEDCPLDFI